ncbi:MAG: 50S ribosomal protein L30 [Acetobacteraceae bacterium]
MPEEKRIVVRQIAAGGGRKPGQRETLAGLGLGRPGRSRVLTDTPAVRGMIRKVAHLVAVEEIPGEALPSGG